MKKNTRRFIVEITEIIDDDNPSDITYPVAPEFMTRAREIGWFQALDKKRTREHDLAKQREEADQVREARENHADR